MNVRVSRFGKDISVTAETSIRGRIIPRSGDGTVVGAMLGLLAGLPVDVRQYGATLAAEITSEEFTVACSRLMGAQRQVIVRAKFQTGDMWDQWQGPEFSVERSRWMAALRLRLPNDEVREKYLQEFRHCGWVARSWPESKRSDSHSWTWHVKREVVRGVVGLRSGVGGAASMRGVCRVIRDDGEFIEMLSPTEKPAVWRVCELPVKDERTATESGSE